MTSVKNRSRWVVVQELAKELFSPNIKAPIESVKEKKVPVGYMGDSRGVMTYSFTGEKNLGEMGPAINYNLDYDIMRVRSWQSMLESDVCKTIISRYNKWKIGKGLKLQCEPDDIVLASESISIDKYKFSTIVEARYALHKRSRKSDYSGMRYLDKLASIASTNAIVGGDVLVLKRFDGKNITTQLIDGCHVRSPLLGSEQYVAVLENGNRLINGIEMDGTGKHVAFWVYTCGASGIPEYRRIEARSKTNGLQIAFLIYGSEHRLDNVRGLPLLAACLETAKKMERYKEAVLGSAEEIAKIVYQVVHQVYSDGSNPLAERLAQIAGFDGDKPEQSVDALGQAVADKVAATTNKTALNMPIGAKLEAVKNDTPLQFKDFYSVNSKLVCATVGIPHAVAFSDYDGSYSSSRAGIMDWAHTLDVDRDDFGMEFYQKDYEFWLDVMVEMGKIYAPGYIYARETGDDIVLSAFRKTRWVGAQVPHIDPLKEVLAEREKLGTAAGHIPLTTVEASTERLDGGEAPSNMEQFSNELKRSEQLGIKPPETTPNISTQAKAELIKEALT